MKKPLNSTGRHELILDILQKEGKVSIESLVKKTGVSGVTIRKDLKLLEQKNLLYPISGGASLTNPYIMERHINEKELLMAKEKQDIAREALHLIQSQQTDSIIIGSGTTVFALAQALSPVTPLTVITPAVKVTLEVSNKPNIQVLQLGGVIRPNSSSVAGPSAEKTLSEISSGIFFMGVDGIDLNFGFSISNLQEANLDRIMISASQKTAVLADSTKLGKRGIGKVCGFNDINYLITDNKADKSIVSKIEDLGVKVIIAGNH